MIIRPLVADPKLVIKASINIFRIFSTPQLLCVLIHEWDLTIRTEVCQGYREKKWEQESLHDEL